MSTNRLQVLSVGPVSYVGGINVHMTRLSSILSDSVVFDFVDDAPPQIAKDSYSNIRNASSFPHVVRKICQSDIVHIHSGNWLLRLLLVLASRLLQAKVVVTLHSYRLTGFKKIASDTALRLSNEVICVNPDIKNSLRSASALVKEAFLPPVDEERANLPGKIEAFIESSRDSVLICANAYRLTRYEGKDLYGLDQCLAIARQAKAKSERIMILFVVGTVMANDDLYYAAQKTIADEELEGFIMIYPQSLDFISLIRYSDIVLRPTVTDGDALTIREALFLGKPVIASDVVARPAGTITYKSEDIDDLYVTITNVVSEIAAGRSATAECCSSSTEEYKNFYLEVYKKCIS